MSFFSLVATIFFVGCHAYSTEDAPDSVYDIMNSSNIKTINCNNQTTYVAVTDQIDWYEYNTDSIYQEFQLSVCGSISNKWLYIIFDGKVQAGERLMTINDIVGICFECGIDPCKSLSFSFSDFGRGRYLFGVDNNYTLKLNCTLSDSHSVTGEESRIVFIAGSSLIIVCVLIVLYIYCSAIKRTVKKKIIKKKRETERASQIPIELATINTTSNRSPKNLQKPVHFISISGNSDNGSPIESTSPTKEPEEEKVAAEEKEEKEDEVEEDPILAIIDNILMPCAEDPGCLDVYQLLAFRRLDHRSNIVRRIFKKCSWLLTVSSYQILLLACTIVGSLQVYGISVTLSSVIGAYFEGGVDSSISNDAQCEWQLKEWKVSWRFKLLAFLWSAIISFSVGVFVSDVRTKGLYSILKEVKHYKELSNMIDFAILQMGVIINLYALLVAVIGSFFLIYASEGGSDALDMILNAVALYFLLEVDDLIVSEKDANALKIRVEEFRIEYLARKNGEIIEYEDELYVQPKPCCGIYLLSIWIFIGKICRYIVQFTVGICALIAPWAIMLCW